MELKDSCSWSEASVELGDQDFEKLREQKTLYMWANCLLKHCLLLKTFTRSFLCIVGNYIILHSQDVVLGHYDKTGVYTDRCFIIQLPGGGHCPFVRDSEPIRLLEIPMSPSLYVLIIIVWTLQAKLGCILINFKSIVIVNKKIGASCPKLVFCHRNSYLL